MTKAEIAITFANFHAVVKAAELLCQHKLMKPEQVRKCAEIYLNRYPEIENYFRDRMLQELQKEKVL